MHKGEIRFHLLQSMFLWYCEHLVYLMINPFGYFVYPQGRTFSSTIQKLPDGHPSCHMAKSQTYFLMQTNILLRTLCASWENSDMGSKAFGVLTSIKENVACTCLQNWQIQSPGVGYSLQVTELTHHRLSDFTSTSLVYSSSTHQ